MAELNNRAVLLLKEARADEALALLRQALVVLVDALTQAALEELNGSTTKEVTSSCTQFRTVAVPLGHGFCEVDDPGLFAEAFWIPEQQSVHSEHPERTASASMVLFNLALVIHLLALLKGRGRTKSLEAAVAIYGKAFDMMRTVSACFPDDVGKKILLMALANNMIQVHLALLNKEDAFKYQNMLAGTVASLPCASLVTDTYDCSFFFWAIFDYLSPLSKTGAPSA